jgi:hypothetical protein
MLAYIAPMAVEIPVRFDSRYNFNRQGLTQPDKSPFDSNRLDADLLAFADKNVPKIDRNLRNIIMRTHSQVIAIPTEELEVVAYDLDQQAIDNPSSRELLKTTSLTNLVSDAKADVSIVALPLRIEKRKAKDKEIRRGILNRVAWMRITNILSRPGETKIELDKEQKNAIHELISKVVFEAKSPATDTSSAA